MKRRTSEKENYLKLIVYGAGGSGKTTFASTFDEALSPERVLILESAGNPQIILGKDPAPWVISLERSTDVDELYGFLQAGQPEKHILRGKLGIPPDVRFGAVAIDTLTDLQRVIKDEVVSAGSRPMAIRAPKIQEWGEITAKTVQVVRLFLMLPMHVIFTCQEKSDMDAFANSVEYNPFIQGQGSYVIPAAAPLVLRLVRKPYSEKPEPGKQAPPTRLATIAYPEPGTGFFAKNQLIPGLGPVVDPTAAYYINLLTQNKENK